MARLTRQHLMYFLSTFCAFCQQNIPDTFSMHTSCDYQQPPILPDILQLFIRLLLDYWFIPSPVEFFF